MSCFPSLGQKSARVDPPPGRPEQVSPEQVRQRGYVCERTCSALKQLAYFHQAPRHNHDGFTELNPLQIATAWFVVAP